MKRIFYHANFCAECGNPIEPRLRWRPTHFCAECETRLGKRRPIMTLLALFSGASLLVSGLIRNPPPAAPASSPAVSARDAVLSPRPAGAPAPITSPAITVEWSTCGARTKKGTPCRHRTPAGERCAQHRGRPSISH
ncbi:MAG: hypothetical protein ACKVX9_23185 [Blastocatellia bacterium]